MSHAKEVFLSVVVPVYDEEGAVADLHTRIMATVAGLNQPCELIFVNDGSKDKTLGALKALRPIKIIDFRRNFGQTAAMDAGIKAATGKYIVTMDGDGQNDPADIPALIAKLEEGNLDVVSGWRKNRKDTFGKRLSSRLAAALRRVLINDGIHDSGCSLKIYRRECFDGVDLYGEMHRFIPALLKIRGFRIGEMEVRHHPRTTGRTKYNLKRSVKGCLDMVAVWFWKKYSNRPLHLFGGLGAALLAASVMAAAVVFFNKFVRGIDLSDTAMTTCCMVTFLTGVQLLVAGLLADMLAKCYYAARRETPYVIKEIIERTK
jgi:glycosyltransferase involved in cell wall biosynthesis